MEIVVLMDVILTFKFEETAPSHELTMMSLKLSSMYQTKPENRSELILIFVINRQEV